jgi:hypothetical protein
VAQSVTRRANSRHVNGCKAGSEPTNTLVSSPSARVARLEIKPMEGASDRNCLRAKPTWNKSGSGAAEKGRAR